MKSSYSEKEFIGLVDDGRIRKGERKGGKGMEKKALQFLLGLRSTKGLGQKKPEGKKNI